MGQHPNLRTLRVNRLWTQAILARTAGVDPSEVSRAERGKPISKFSRVKLARVFDLDPDVLFPVEPEPAEAAS